jgi:hypothetical protein
MVPEAGLEPALLSKSDFESDVSTNFTTRASSCLQLLNALLNATADKTKGLYLANYFKQVFYFKKGLTA